MGRVLRVDLSRSKISVKQLEKSLVRLFVGGRGFGAKMLWDELPRKVDPLSPSNKVIMATGPLTGTYSPASCKVSLVSKSPLTYGYADSSVGGGFAAALKQAGYDVVVLEGASESPVYLYINNGDVELRDARHLWGRRISDVEAALRQELGREFRVLSIGPAGENLVKYASLVTELGRASGRTGMGAIIGSKKVKAIAVYGDNDIPVYDLDELVRVSDEAYSFIRKHDDYDWWIEQGTVRTVDWCQKLGFLPTRNMREAYFERAEEIDGASMAKRKVAFKSCFACNMPCCNPCASRDGAVLSELDHENVAMLGSNCGIGSMDDVIKLNKLCDELGLDTISTGSAVAFTMECYERGLLNNYPGVKLEFGNSAAAAELIEGIAYRKGLGALLADGIAEAAKKIGNDAEFFAMHVKRLEISAYESRTALGQALAYGTCDVGAHHNRCWMILEEVTELGRFNVSIEKAKHIVFLQNARALFDILGSCRFTWVELKLPLTYYPRIFKAVTSMDYSLQDLLTVSERVWSLTRAFWAREIDGFGRSYDYVPRRWLEEPLPSGQLAGKHITKEDYDKLLDLWYKLRGWDEKTGLPTRGRLIELGLGDVALELYKAVEVSD